MFLLIPKMNYLRDKKRTGRNKLLAALAIFFIVFLFSATSFGGITGNFLERIAPPLWKVGDNISSFFSNFRAVFFSKTSLLIENAELKKELRDTSLKLLDRNLLYEENLSLKEQLGRSGGGQSIFARVLAKPGMSLYDTLVIDVGTKEGIKGGERVLYGDNVLIGEVAEVHERTAKVKLYSSPGEQIAVTIGTRAVPAIAVGYGGGNFEIKIPRDTPIAEGDAILAPSLMAHFLGVVEHIEVKSNDPFEQILFKSPVPIFEMDEVTVLINE